MRKNIQNAFNSRAKPGVKCAVEFVSRQTKRNVTKRFARRHTVYRRSRYAIATEQVPPWKFDKRRRFRRKQNARDEKRFGEPLLFVRKNGFHSFNNALRSVASRPRIKNRTWSTGRCTFKRYENKITEKRGSRSTRARSDRRGFRFETKTTAPRKMSSG